MGMQPLMQLSWSLLLNGNALTDFQKSSSKHDKQGTCMLVYWWYVMG